jgi:stage III sporulation protein AE
VNGDLPTIINGHLSQFDTSSLDQPGMPSFGELVIKAASGELDLSMSNILDMGVKVLFNEFFLNTALIRQLLVVAVISAALGVLAEAFKHKGAGELGFYVTVCMVGMLAVSSFKICAGILTDVAGTLKSMTEASVPLMLGMMAISGNAAGAAVFRPVIFFAMQLITQAVILFFIPLVTSAACLHMINFITETNHLDKLALALKKLADWTLKGIVAVFMALLALQKLSAPAVNNAVLKTAKSVAGAVPVVGDALNAAVDTVLFWGQAAKSGVLVALVVTLCVVMAVPLIKMAVLTLIFKLAAAAAQPLCELRLVRCLEGVGDYMGALIGAGAMLAVTAVFTVVVMLSY